MKRAVAASIVFFASVASADPTKEQCIAADTHAQELRKDGKLRDALTELDVCTNPECPAMIRSDCSERVEEINHAMPSVVFDVRTSSGVDVPDTRVEMDGRVLRERLDGHPVSVDPGDHTLVLSARGTTQTFHVLVSEGDKDRHVAMVVATTTPAPIVSPSHALQTIGLIVGGMGLAGLGLGSAFGAIAIVDHQTVTSSCPSNVCPSTDAMARVAGTNADAQSFATAATATFVVGAILTAVGITLVAIAPRHRTIVVGVDGLRGTF